MKQYDLIVVLGYGFIDNWELSDHVRNRLKRAAGLYQNGVAKKIAVCGKWSLAWDQKHIVPPTTEADAMKNELIKLSIPKKAILKEEFSKDTVGNAFYLKTKIAKKSGYTRLLILCADYAVKRVEYIFYKVFQPTYSITIIPTVTPYKKSAKVLKAQEEVLKLQKKFLGKMKRGDDAFLEKRLYSDPYYHQEMPKAVTLVALGGKK